MTNFLPRPRTSTSAATSPSKKALVLQLLPAIRILQHGVPDDYSPSLDQELALLRPQTY